MLLKISATFPELKPRLSTVLWQPSAYPKVLWFTLFLLVLQFIPYLLLQDQAYIRIHDTLEGEGFWYQLLLDSGWLFDYSKEALIEQVMNGLPRKVLPTAWSFFMFWIALLGLYAGYIVNYVIIHLIGFIGMLLFLRRYWISSNQDYFIALGIALCFSWLPVFTTFGLSVMGQPLLLYALLNITENRIHWSDFLIIGLFPFYSSIIWAAPPLGIVLLLLYGTNWSVQRQHNIRLILAGLLLVALYIIINFQWFDLLLFPGDFVSHRTEYSYLYSKPLGLLESLKQSFLLLGIGHYHVATMISLPIILAVLWGWLYGGIKKREGYLIAAILALAFFYGFYNYLTFWLGDMMPLIETFKFERLRIVLPFLALLLLASLLSWINRKGRVRLVWSLLGAQFLFIVAANDEFQHNLRQLSGYATKPNFQAFFAPSLFDEIANYIDQPKSDYRVVHLGIHPSVSQFNGFYTLDSHHSIYDLNYKKQFGQSLSKELQKNEVVYKEFYLWGNRCYLYSSELGKEGMVFFIGKDENKEVEKWEVDFEPLKTLGAKYLFSAVPINNAIAIGLQPLKTFEHIDFYWKIYLYEIK